ncbi:aminodeoxychorismate/anthranilate synthase component II [Bacillus sp. JCM 19041]|uniref:aminodeoxychorismate/anthranilate synthase component II n=1 Tax=Bacillus sp. JCM 19041 TaxID=1460637 RepID=UPI0006CF6C0D
MILMIDNYDSFTYNLVQYLGEMGEELIVRRNDEITIQEIRELNPSIIMISPGPCSPDEAGISLETVRTFAGATPIFGVCLGHQAIAQAFGGKVIRAKRLMHGKTSPIHHNNETVFADLPNPMVVTRYHSLIVERHSLPSCFEITAETAEGEIMAIRHKEYAIEGVQFHPESILTVEGKQMLRQFIDAYKVDM